jgi:shikimate dehydrogenase
VGLALVDLGVTSIRVAVRDASRASETVDVLRSHPAEPEVSVELLTDRQRSDGPDLAASASTVDVVVSTIPAAAQTPALVDRFRDVPVVFEALYDPWPTPLAASVLDGPGERVVVGGLDLLVHQAALQFELFTGLAAPIAVMRDAGERALGLQNPA